MKILSLIISFLFGVVAHAAPGEFLTDVTESAVLELLDQDSKYSLATHLNQSELEKNFKAEKSSTGELAKLNLLRLNELSKNSSWFRKIEKRY